MYDILTLLIRYDSGCYDNKMFYVYAACNNEIYFQNTKVSFYSDDIYF